MLGYLVVTMYWLLPLTLLTSDSIPSGVFYVLMFVSLVLLVKERFAGGSVQTRQYGWLIVGYSILFLSVAASSVYYGEWAGANSEGALRVFLGLWVLLLALPHVDRQVLQYALWGVIASCFVSTAVVLWLSFTVTVRPLTPGVIITTYSSIMLLLGAISVYSLNWKLSAFPRFEQTVKILASVATFGGFLVAQTRTGLLGLPLFVLLGIVLFAGIGRPRRLLALLGVSAVLLIAVVGGSDSLRHRLVQGIQEVQVCQGEGSTSYSSMCIRLQLWHSAIDAGMTNPWVGLGDGGRYPEYLRDVAVHKGLIAQRVVDEDFGEPHNDVMLFFAGFGFPGALGILLIYLAPCFYFLPRLMRSGVSPQLRAAAAMGLAACLGFALFGLTETMFRRMNTMGFYVAFVALFMVLSESTPRRRIRR
ncbi:MAG TPA: hypothetical protein DEB15_06705 [Pusillimonas sp.]|nr:hypothetical protein [Pusillimonas sp.]